MIFRRTIGFLRQASRINGSSRPAQSQMSLPFSMSFKSYIHSGKPLQFETEGGSVNFIQELLDGNSSRNPGRPFDYAPSPFQENRNSGGYSRGFNQPLSSFQENRNFGGYNRGFNQPLSSFRENRNFGGFNRGFNQPSLETNADIVHIKLMRNNAFVTVTNSKGEKKAGISTGKLAGKGTKIPRYSAEAAAENMGREVRKMKTKAVVVKVNGFTFFRKKKDAILSFKDGYTNSRAEGNPIVFIEDTTRKPHNGCRLKKKRRI